MRIIIETIPHDQQRYTTVGDWFYTEEWDRPKGTEMGPSKLWIKVGVLNIRVSQLSDWRREMLVAIHELVEVTLCKDRGISQEDVDNFDQGFEESRASDDFSEPGDQPDAPYVKQHCIATGIERLLAAELGVNWTEYEKELDALPEVKPKP